MRYKMGANAITTNFYEVIHKLESFKKELNSSSKLNEIEGLILQLKTFIFSVNELKDLYIQRVNAFADFLPPIDIFSEGIDFFNPNIKFNEEFEDVYINVFAKVLRKEYDYSRCMSYLFYYPTITDYIDLDDYMRMFPIHNGIISLYRNMSHVKLDECFMLKYKEVLEAVDFYLLKFFDCYYDFPFDENSPSLLCALATNEIDKKFTLLFIKSVCNGVIHRLCIEISKNFIPKYYNENVQKSVDIKSCLPHELLSLSEQEKKVYFIFYKAPHTIVREVAEQMGVSSTYINNIISKCCSRLGLTGENVTALRDYINLHK